MIKFILFFICIKLGSSYPNGAPISVCTSMIPSHDVEPRQCQSKYIIQSSKSEYNSNETIRITVRGSTNNDYFKGILLIAKSQNNQQIIGTWSIINSTIKTISCNDTKNTAITHSSADDKLGIDALWHAPSTLLQEKIIIKATIVKSYDEIYVDCFNITLTAKKKTSSSVQSIQTNTRKDILTKPNTNITLEYADNVVTVTMTTGQVNVDEWRSIGFSLDRQMGDEYIFVCQVSSSGDVSLRRMHTKLGKRSPSLSNDDVHVIDAVYENGLATCKFSFETTSEQADGEPTPLVIEKNYYLIFAAGLLRSEEQIAKHSFTFVTSKTYQLQNSEIINLDETITTTTITGASTSLSTGSLMTSTTAAQTNDISVNISWTYIDGITNVKMIINNLKESQWFAIGLSHDDLMGEDHVFICQHLADNTISLQRFINPIGHSRPILVSRISNSGGIFNVIRQKFENGIAYCDFTLSNFVDMKRRPRQNDIPELSQTTSYRPLIAFGNMDSSNMLLRHSKDSRTPLSQIVLLNRQETIIYNIQSIESDSMSLMKAHGIIMVFTWIVLASTGILIARYFKRSWSDRKICRKAVWFAIHRTIMTCVAILTLISFVLIIVYKKGQWIPQTDQREFVHSITGIIIISFAICQPFIALFRCNPDDQYRFIFNYVHAIVGFSAFILSIAAIFLAMFFTQFNFQLNKEWAILVAWSCWLPIIFVIFEIIEIYFRKSSSTTTTTTDKTDSYAMNDRDGSGTTKVETIQMRENVKKDRIKGLFLLLHIIIAFGLALALIVLIGQS